MRKKLFLFGIGFILVILASVPAFAGDWEDMMNKAPDEVTGTIVALDTKPTVKINHGAAPYGALPVKGDKKVLASTRSYSKGGPEERAAMEKAVTETDPTKTWMIPGERFDTISTGKNPAKYIKESSYMSNMTDVAYVWRAETETQKCRVLLQEGCGNVYISCLPKPPAPPPKEEIVKVEKEEPVEKIEEDGFVLFDEFEPEKCKTEFEFEPIVAAGYWENRIAKGWWAYGEFMLWGKNTCLSGDCSFGLGGYASYGAGESKIMTYDWGETAVGGQLGAKCYSLLENKEGKTVFHQWQAKFRILGEHLWGRNNEGYSMNQYDFKLGFYGEDVLQLNDRWLRIINGEIWYAFNRTIYSTWSGDAPSQRFNVYLNWMYQYKVSENWQIRFGGGPAYTGWDEMFWFNLGFEFRWKEFIMFGPGLAIPLGVNGKYYPGMTVADLLTWRAMVRVEFGRPLYWHFQEQKAAEVRKLRKETSRYKRAGD